MNVNICELIARKMHRIRQDHQDNPAVFLTAFTMEAVAIARWIGMDADTFLSYFGEAFRMADAGAVEGYAQPTIIGKEGAS